MDKSTQQFLATVLATVLTLSGVGGVAILAGAGTVAADQHGPDEAPTFETTDGEVDWVITLPERTDHYPGDHPVHSDSNGYNASIEYSATGKTAFTSQNAEEGLWLNFIDIGAEWIDYSECDATENTKVFGIDRDADNEGTNVDEDLIEHRRSSTLFAGGLIVQFFDWGDLAGNPPYLSPEDSVVAAQGAGSNAGPCLKMTSEPGWYQVQAYTNGTIANKCTEEGNSECEPDDKEWRGLNLNSNYVYICECDSEQEAREELGPPPNEQNGGGDDGGSGDATPTPTPESADTPTPTPESANTPTPTQQPADTPTATQAGGGTGGNQQSGGNGQQSGGANQQSGGNQGAAQQGGANDGQADRSTPTIGEGPGFTPIAALVALLAAALFVVRRD